MANLATLIMEGSGVGYRGSRLKHRYDHEDGAALIAMESAQALRDIFEDAFYTPNTCTINAALEGYSCVTESSHMAIMEAAASGAFEKIKQFFITLRDKVKDMLHNIKRYLSGIFGNDEKWVKDYEKELKALDASSLKGYNVKLYKYEPVKALNKTELTAYAESLISYANKDITTLMKGSAVLGDDDDDFDEEALEEYYDKKLEEYMASTFEGLDVDDVQKSAWSIMRDDATGEADKDTVEVTTSIINSFITILKNGSKDVSAYDKTISGVNSAYEKCIKFIGKVEKLVEKVDPSDKNKDTIMGDDYAKVGVKSTDEVIVGMSAARKKNDKRYTVAGQKFNEKGKTHVLGILRSLSSHMSKMQSVENTVYNAAKSAMQERNKEYKKVLVGAFGYSRKHSDKKK